MNTINYVLNATAFMQSYGEGRIQFHKSFEEQENDNYLWLKSLSPEQHLYYATQLIKRVFANELKQHPGLGNKIKFEN